MSVILRNPSVAKKMQEEIELVVGRERSISEGDIPRMEYVQHVVKETLMLYLVASLLLPHESTPRLYNWGILHFCEKQAPRQCLGSRDAFLWEDPLEFSPERFLGKNIDVVRDKEYFDILPFSARKRGCPGAAMDDVSMNLMLAQLVHCFD
ncbi:hypothetical protein SUGI_0421030 [Cryptomeria japonica]|nr:hypothetical protein SUGI_0421030 [Cryptomeria japonica]